jgi:hypothetical protein
MENSATKTYSNDFSLAWMHSKVFTSVNTREDYDGNKCVLHTYDMDHLLFTQGEENQ